MNKQDELDAILRSNPPSFIQKVFHTIASGESFYPNWHIMAIAWQLQRIMDGQLQRLLITVPPRYLKSIICSVAFPALLLGINPSLNIVCVSYSMPLALKHARDCRRVMESSWYKRLFPNTRLDPSKNTEAEFITTRGGGRYTCSVGDSVTGRGGDIIIIDDANKADDAHSVTALDNTIEWFTGTLSSRLNNKRTGSIIIIQQRLHEKDLAGFVLEQGGYEHLNLPAIAEENERIQISATQYHTRAPGDLLHPEREPQDVLDQLNRDLGSYAFAAQYQQRPVPEEGGMVKWEWFVFYRNPPEKSSEDQIVQSWDTACKAGVDNDYSVCTTWLMRKNQFYLINVYRAQLEYPDLLSKIKTKAKYFKADRVIIEDKGAGTSVIQDLKKSSDLAIVKFEPKVDKKTRLYTVTNVIEAGKVLLPKEASWLDLFRHELLKFPRGKHDDQVDSFSQFLQWAKDRKLPNKLHVYVAYSPYRDMYEDPLIHPSLCYGPPDHWKD